MWQAIAYCTDRSNTNFSNKLLANLKKIIIEALHNSENFYWSLEFQTNHVLQYKHGSVETRSVCARYKYCFIQSHDYIKSAG
jgi:hypothetical protein